MGNSNIQHEELKVGTRVKIIKNYNERIKSRMKRKGIVTFKGKYFITVQFERYRESFLLYDLNGNDKIEYYVL